MTFSALGTGDRETWYSIWFEEGADTANSVVRNAVLSHGGSEAGALRLHARDVLVQDVEITGSQWYAVWLDGGTFAAGSSGLNIHDNGMTVYVETGDDADSIPTDGLNIADNTDPYIWVSSNSNPIEHDATWAIVETEYASVGNLWIGSADAEGVLRLDPGVTLRMDADKIINVGDVDHDVGGSIVAEGTADAPVRILPLEGDTIGVWGGLWMSQPNSAVASSFT